MADENPTPVVAVDAEDEALRPEGLRALKAERENVSKLKAERDELLKWKTTQEDAGKSELEKITAELSKYKSESEKASRDALRLRVAMETGLTAKQAARLVGDDEEALRADAEDLLSTFKPATPVEDAETPDVELDGRPKERLKGGARPAEAGSVLDPLELAKSIRRGV